MESPSAAVRFSPRRLGPGPILLGILLLAFGMVVGPFVFACAGGSDSSGYLNQARLLAAGKTHLSPRRLPGLADEHFSEFLYSPLGMVPQHGTLVPTYPIGLPLWIAAAAPVVGWAHAADAVILAHALAGLLFLYMLERAMGLGWRGALIGCAVLALSPLYLDFSVQAMSDLPALTWAAAAGWAAWRSRERPRLAALAGVFLSIGVLVRPTNLLMVVPMAVAWGPAWRRYAWCALGGLPGALLFLAYNRAAYGSPFLTGYGNPGSLFDWAIVKLTARHYVRWLPALLTPGVWLFLPLAARRDRTAVFLLAWAAVFLGFYASYQFTHETWWYLRFVLPAFPALIAGALLTVRWILSAWPRRRALGPAGRTFLGLAALLGIAEREVRWDRRLFPLFVGEGQRSYPLTMDWLQAYVPADAVLLCMQTSGSAFYYTGFTILRWDQIDRAHFPEVTRAAAGARRPLYAPLFSFEQDAALRERMPGLWRPATKIGEVTVWQWMGDERTR